MSNITAAPGNDVLITPAELIALQEQGAHLVILDVRFDATDAKLRPTTILEHIPGATYVDVVNELAGVPGPDTGRRPLPRIEDLQRDARRWGINEGSHVILYDERKNVQAARGWWVLRWAGVAGARLLNGGLGGWIAAGGRLTTALSLAKPGNVTLTPGHLPTIDADEAAELSRQGLLLDARDHAAFAAGHIPKAISVPSANSLNPDGTFKAAKVLRAGLQDMDYSGDRPIGVYCGAGVAAAHTVAALRIAGMEAALYPGSWSAWTSDPDRPIEKS